MRECVGMLTHVEVRGQCLASFELLSTRFCKLSFTGIRPCPLVSIHIVTSYFHTTQVDWGAVARVAKAVLKVYQ